jgi:hypothetical protein
MDETYIASKKEQKLHIRDQNKEGHGTTNFQSLVFDRNTGCVFVVEPKA